MKTVSAIISAAFITTSFSYAGGEGWMQDFEAAKKKAADENKDLLVDFTGSDWCGWCIKLNEEVFQHDPFKKGVADKFILVELDYPRDKSKLSEEIIAQNEKLQEKYQVRGFPTILLTDAEGLPYAQTGYQQGGPEKYVEHLVELMGSKKTRDEKFADAEKASGIEKAKALAAGLKEVPDDHRHHYSEVIEEIKALDPKDETGLIAAEEAKAARAALETNLEAAFKAEDPDKALTLVDEHIAKFKIEGEEKQEILSYKVGILMQQEKFDKLEGLVDEIIALAPESQMGKSAANFKNTQLKKMLEAENSKEEEPAEAEEKPEPAAKPAE